jgi:hypothetical protein
VVKRSGSISEILKPTVQITLSLCKPRRHVGEWRQGSDYCQRRHEKGRVAMFALLPGTRSLVATAHEGRWVPRSRSGRFGEQRSLLLLPSIGPRTVKPSAQSVKQLLRHDGSNALLGVNINFRTRKMNLNVVKMRVSSCVSALTFMRKSCENAFLFIRKSCENSFIFM